ncbi:MAG: 2-C-methyl-D-erythritol 4-phosphate cytidylyltransferase, partial [Betaproteobacteria bacterium]|nr:2-C-methyl-D-erythritol 4-phosphate cytidylyltransferase [Betaproteobacteria bacterium]
MKPRIHALIPCAGNGSRAGGEQPKQYRLLLGKAVVQHALDALRALGSQLNSLHVVLAAGDTQFALTQPAARHAREQVHAVGGATRAGTVRNGLHALLGQPDTAPDDWVLVHDAARCLVTPAQIAQLIAACEGDAVGGLLALPLADTLKRAAGARVQATVPRDGLWL